MSKDYSKTSFLLPLGGAVAGAATSATIGGVGLVGSFGGIGLGIGAMTGVGTIAGAAAYGAFQAIETGDTIAYTALGLGALGGAGVYSTVGGMGLGMGGTAFSIGLGTMALSGGIVGLGVYGFTKILSNKYSANYYANLYFFEQITKEYQEEQIWKNLEIDDELNELKEKLKDKIDHQALLEKRKIHNQVRVFKQEKSLLMNKLKSTYSSFDKYTILKKIDEIEKAIKLIET